jgi:riboflavin-specific deaminase-like protein
MKGPPRDRPHVSVNFAITWDGRITTRARGPVTFSSKFDKRRLLEIRALADAIMVSATTASVDRMTMGLPAEDLRAARESRGQSPYPLRVLVSNSGRIDPALAVFQKTFSPLVIFSTRRMPRRVQTALAKVADLRLSASETAELPDLMRTLRQEYKIRRLHCEGGGRIFHSLLAANLVDEIYLTACPRIFGGANTTTLTGPPGSFLPASTRAKLEEMEVHGDECFLRYTVAPA